MKWQQVTSAGSPWRSLALTRLKRTNWFLTIFDPGEPSRLPSPRPSPRGRGRNSETTLPSSDGNLQWPAIRIAAFLAAPVAKIINDEEPIVARGLFDGHVVRGEHARREADDVAPRCA